METFASNLSGSIRRATVGGREFIVAPLSLIVPGVLNGSRGPLLYPEDEVRRDVGIWNGMPLTRGHPTRNGQPVSARIPEVLQEYGIGTVFHARFDPKANRLSAEGWFDVANLQRLDPNLLDAVNRGDRIELSTGLFLDVEERQGTHNGKQYTHVSKNYRADHVAVLVGETGACSKRDGCGVNVNTEMTWEDVTNNPQAYILFENVFCATGAGGGIDPTCPGGGGSGGGTPKAKAIAATKAAADASKVAGGPAAQSAATIQKNVEEAEKGKGVSKKGHGILAKAHDQIADTHYRAMAGHEGDAIVSKDLRGKVSPREAHEAAAYAHQNAAKAHREAAGDSSKQTSNSFSEDTDMNRNQAIEYLTTNCDCWKEGKETLNKMTDAELGKMCESHKASASKEKEMAANLLTANAQIAELKEKQTVSTPTATNTDTKKAQTADEWYASAPAEIQAAVRNAVEIVNKEAADLITQITAPITNEETKKAKAEWLRKKPLDELREIASLVPATNNGPNSTFPRPYFYGAGAPASTPAVNTNKPEEILPLPTCNWEDHSLRPANQTVKVS